MHTTLVCGLIGILVVAYIVQFIREAIEYEKR